MEARPTQSNLTLNKISHITGPGSTPKQLYNGQNSPFFSSSGPRQLINDRLPRNFLNNLNWLTETRFNNGPLS